MKCPFCALPDTRVINSRPSAGGESIRRRRLCEKCNGRFTTFEIVERAPNFVIKRDGVRERFDPEKIRVGIDKACEKRPVTTQQIDEMAAAVESEAFAGTDREVSTEQLGRLILRKLKETDKVAYLRFLSVYKHFCDLQDFDSEIQSLLKG